MQRIEARQSNAIEAICPDKRVCAHFQKYDFRAWSQFVREPEVTKLISRETGSPREPVVKIMCRIGAKCIRLVPILKHFRRVIA
jgi:hypothetical protein